MQISKTFLLSEYSASTLKILSHLLNLPKNQTVMRAVTDFDQQYFVAGNLTEKPGLRYRTIMAMEIHRQNRCIAEKDLKPTKLHHLKFEQPFLDLLESIADKFGVSQSAVVNLAIVYMYGKVTLRQDKAA